MSTGKLSVITPAFNESANLGTLHQRLSAVMDRAAMDWEWIVVDDHSSDGTIAALEAIAAADAHVRVVRLSRPHGADAAMRCGVEEASGDAAVVIAGDLQDPPEQIPELVRRWKDGVRIVWAVRRGGGSPPTLLARLHHAALRRVVGISGAATDASFVLIDRQVIDAVRQFPDPGVNAFALLGWLGFRQDAVDYEGSAAAPAGLSLMRQVDLIASSVAPFSGAPIRAGAIGGVVVASGGVACVLLAVLGIELGPLSPGWVLLLGGILFVGGLNLLLVGIVGEYVWRAIDGSRNRPRYVVERRF